MYSVQRDNADRRLEEKKSKKVEKTMITKSVALKDQLLPATFALVPKKFASWALGLS